MVNWVGFRQAAVNMSEINWAGNQVSIEKMLKLAIDGILSLAINLKQRLYRLSAFSFGVYIFHICTLSEIIYR